MVRVTSHGDVENLPYYGRDTFVASLSSNYGCLGKELLTPHNLFKKKSGVSEKRNIPDLLPRYRPQ
jgi:hypothetical protein